MGKIAAGLNTPTSSLVAQGDGWSVADVVCTAGPRDRPFEERHSQFSVAIVTAGSFHYRSSQGHALMTPGSILLGNPGQSFECGHEHHLGDRCLSFRFAPDYFARMASDAGGSPEFRVPQLPPLRATSAAITRACAGRLETNLAWEEISLQFGACAVRIASGLKPAANNAPPSAVARVTAAVRRIEQDWADELDLAELAREARLSPYHFLRTFQSLTGVTPHQYILRTRLREAALRLGREHGKILDIALDCGFRDLSNFNRAFRAEFGVSPRGFRQSTRGAH